MKTLLKLTIGLCISTFSLVVLYRSILPFNVISAANKNHIEPSDTPSTSQQSLFNPISNSRKIEPENRSALPREEMVYTKAYVELPLASEDYYSGKFTNAAAAVNELNSMSTLEAGDRIAIINDGYLTMNADKGYIKPQGKFLYASGVCWTVSTLGTMMDKANADFSAQYNLPLFVFNNGDRFPHPHTYKTYTLSNNGWGYSVSKFTDGSSSDYKFTVNPEIAHIPELEGLKIKIVMQSVTSNKNGYLGQSINAYLLTNIDF